MPLALTVDAVSKRFVIHRDRPRTLRESVIRRLRGQREIHEPIWALSDVSFAVERGRALGIIGHNGAGKSTLLRLLCGLGRPTAGRITRAGHVTALLELGGGFNLELSGRDNVTTAGLLSGLTEREVRAREGEIVAFAELEHAIDQPMRTYSSGMYLRLAFAVAICLDPSILVVDEVLAVGDSRFQQRCIERIAGFRAAGRTLIMTSHNRDQILALCDQVLVLEDGRAVICADSRTALACYEDLMRRRTESRRRRLSGAAADAPSSDPDGSRQGTQEAAITGVRVLDADARTVTAVSAGGGVTVELDYRIDPTVTDVAVSLGLYNDTHVKCFETLVPSATMAFGPLGGAGTLRCWLPALPLLGGRYWVTVGLYPPDYAFTYDYHWRMHPLAVVDAEGWTGEVSGVVAVRPTWSSAAHANAALIADVPCDGGMPCLPPA